MWTLEEALECVRDLEPLVAKTGWHVALAGGVLHKGASEHDLDLVLIPHTSKYTARKALRAVLRSIGWRLVKTSLQMRAYWRTKGSMDAKHVEVWRTPNGRRVDLIVMRS